MTRRFTFLSVPLLALASLLAFTAAHAQTADFRLGTAIDAAQADRSITIGTDTRWANVMQGESVRFVSGQNTFGWKFDGTLIAVDLARIAPAGFVARPLTVYVASTPQGRRGN